MTAPEYDKATATLEGNEAVQLWLKTLNRDMENEPHLWNDWVQEHPKGNMSFEGVNFGKLRGDVPGKAISFSNFRFPQGRVSFVAATFGRGLVSFNGALFGDGGVNFDRAIFGDGEVNFGRADFGKGEVNFRGTRFGIGDIDFEGAHFRGIVDLQFEELASDGNLNFRNCHFGGPVNLVNQKRGESKWQKIISFEGSAFVGPVNIRDVYFFEMPDFQLTQFAHHLSLNNIDYEFVLRPPINMVPDVIPKLQRLKQIAEDSGNHRLALRLHGDELRAKRWHETPISLSCMDKLFDVLCNYGQSVLRPLLWSLLQLLGFSYYYITRSSTSLSNIEFPKYWLLSVANSLPFLSTGRTIRSESLEGLFAASDRTTMFYTLMSIQSFIAVILVFLIGLGLRNHFKI